jgi:hypothetical protein
MAYSVEIRHEIMNRDHYISLKHDGLFFTNSILFLRQWFIRSVCKTTWSSSHQVHTLVRRDHDAEKNDMVVLCKRVYIFSKK